MPDGDRFGSSDSLGAGTNSTYVAAETKKVATPQDKQDKGIMKIVLVFPPVGIVRHG